MVVDIVAKRIACVLVGYLALGGQKVFERVTSHPFYWVYCGIVAMIDKIAHHPGL